MGNVSAHLDYPLKDSLCVAWHILFGFLVINAFIKQWIIFRCFYKIRTPYANTISEAKRRKKRWTYLILSVKDKDKYFIQYQTLIYQRLSKIVPQDIAFIIIGYYIPNNFIYLKSKNKPETVADNVDKTDEHNITKTNDTMITVEMTSSGSNVTKKGKKGKTMMRKEKLKLLTQIDQEIGSASSSTVKLSNATFSFNKTFDPNQPFTDSTTFEHWCNGNNQEQDIDRKEEIEEWQRKNKGRRRRRRGANLIVPQFGQQYMKTISCVMDGSYLRKHNEQFQDIDMNKKIDIALEQDHKWKLIESVYVLFKNIMLFITTIIFIIAFEKWSATEDNNYLRFIGFILLFHYHPSIASVHIMRWINLDYDKLGYGVWPCASPIFIPLFMWFARHNKDGQDNAKTLYFDGALKGFTFFNHWTGTYGIWLISLPFVFGGGFWFTHIIWLVYLALGIALCILGGMFQCTCGRVLGIDLSGAIRTSALLWIVAFFYHTTGIMYIIGLVFHDRSAPAFAEISTGRYCNDGVISLDISDGRVLWVVLSWIL